MIDISKALEWFKLSPRNLTGLAIISGMYLLLGPRQLAYLGLMSINTQARPWIAVVFLVSVGLLLAHLLSDLVTIGRKWWKQRMKSKSLKAELHKLSPEERAILATYVRRETKTLRLGINSGVAGGLEAAGIIYQSSSIGSMSTGIAYNIQPWAWDYLREHPELLLELPPE